MKTTLTIAALAIAGLSVAAQAQPVNVYGVPHIDVSYADLNLSSRAGAEVMMGRIRFAASYVCGGRPDAREIADSTRYRSCVSVAVRNAIADVNAAMTAQLHTGGAQHASYITVR